VSGNLSKAVSINPRFVNSEKTQTFVLNADLADTSVSQTLTYCVLPGAARFKVGDDDALAAEIVAAGPQDGRLRFAVKLRSRLKEDALLIESQHRQYAWFALVDAQGSLVSHGTWAQAMVGKIPDIQDEVSLENEGRKVPTPPVQKMADVPQPEVTEKELVSQALMPGSAAETILELPQPQAPGKYSLVVGYGLKVGDFGTSNTNANAVPEIIVEGNYEQKLTPGPSERGG
jgi:hypothetical protein